MISEATSGCGAAHKTGQLAPHTFRVAFGVGYFRGEPSLSHQPHDLYAPAIGVCTSWPGEFLVGFCCC